MSQLWSPGGICPLPVLCIAIFSFTCILGLLFCHHGRAEWLQQRPCCLQSHPIYSLALYRKGCQPLLLGLVLITCNLWWRVTLGHSSKTDIWAWTQSGSVSNSASGWGYPRVQAELYYLAVSQKLSSWKLLSTMSKILTLVYKAFFVLGGGRGWEVRKALKNTPISAKIISATKTCSVQNLTALQAGEGVLTSFSIS